MVNHKTFAIILGLGILTVLGVTYASADVSGKPGQTSSGYSQSSGAVALPAPGYPTIYPVPVPPTIQSSINIKQVLFSSIKTSFSDAANKAASSVSGGVALGGRLTIMEQYLVYQFQVLDNNGMMYEIMIDPGTGQVLYTSPGYPISLEILGGMPYPEPMMYGKMGTIPPMSSGQIQKMPPLVSNGTR